MTPSSEDLAEQLRIAAEIGLRDSSGAGAPPIAPIAEAPLRKRPIAWMRYVCGDAQFQHTSDAGDPPEEEGWIALYRRGQP